MMDWDLVLRYAKDAKVDYAPFIGVIYDERKDGDRITVREPLSWRFHIHNRYLVDWAALEAGLPGRERDLVSIVIPVYGKAELTNGCLESLYRHRGTRRFEIVIVNNKSDRATLANMVLWEKARDDVAVVATWTNLNFALGCNVGFARTRGETVVFLNNDTLVTDGWLEPLVEELESGRAGTVQPKLLYPDGTVQSYGAAFSEAGVISHILYRGEAGDAPHVNRRRDLQAIHGACLAVRAEDVVRLRGFDPLYVNGQEDIDFCLRLTAETGKPAVVDPRSTVYHLEGKTRSGRNPHNHRNRALFVERWQGRVKADDQRIYAEDGFTVSSYTPDGEEMVRQGIACFNPKLVRSA
jgi:GT2 family glycosyltransferase